MDLGDEFDPLAVVFPEDDSSGVGVARRYPRSAGSPAGTQAPARDTFLRIAPAPFPADPLLKPVFRDFEQAGVRWCLLGLPERHPVLVGRPGTRREHLTALVERPALGSAKAMLRVNGFAALRPWDQVGREPGAPSGSQLLGEGAQRFVGYNPTTDCWVTLDLAIRLAMGPYGAFETGAEGGCLERRRWDGGVYVLGHDDAFWVLLLQLLLDVPTPEDPLHGAPPPPGFAGLERLGVEARTDGPLARLVGSLLPPRWKPEHLIDCVWEGEWDVLRQLAPKLEAECLARRTWAARRRAFKARLAHRIGAREQFEGFLTASQGFSVALLAPDISGKAMLARDLGRTFYLPVTHVRMAAPPRRRGRTGHLVRAGFFRTLFAHWRRYVLGFLRRARGRLVVFDRYTYDSRMPPATPVKALGRLRRFVLGRACPAPDLVLVLDAPGLFATRRARAVGRSASGAELSPGALRRQYLDLAQRIPDSVVVEAREGRDQLRREVTAHIWRAYAAAPPRPWLRCLRRLRRPWRSGR